MAVPISNVTATWANSAIVFTGIGFNANASAYSASSKLLDLKINNNTIFDVSSNGRTTFTNNMTLPSNGYGTNIIKGGTGDGASFTTYNLKINSWWGIGFGDYQDLSTVKAYLDTRSGHLGLSGSLGVGTAASGTNGEIRATNEVTAYYSDKRLKANIVPISFATEKLKAISGIYYEDNDLAKSYGFTKTERQVGVLAQDVQSVLPEVIRKAPFDLDDKLQSKSGENYLTVKYELLVPLLIEALKEALERIEKLENR